MKKFILFAGILFLFTSGLWAFGINSNPPLTFTKDKLDVSGSSSTVLLNAVQFGILINGTTVYLTPSQVADLKIVSMPLGTTVYWTATQLESLKTEATNYVKNFPVDYPNIKVIYVNTNAVIVSSQPPVTVSNTVSVMEVSTGTYYYVNITSFTGTPSVTANGIGLSWLVDVDGGTAEFNINGGNTIRLIDGQGKSSDFKNLIVNPTINITSLTTGATVSAFIDVKR